MKAIQEVTIPIPRFKDFIEGADLNERQRRWLYGFVANQIGYGGKAAVARALDVSPITVQAGQDETLGIPGKEDNLDKPTAPVGLIHRSDGGRKTVAEKQPGLLDATRGLLESSTVGDPMCVVLWTTLSFQKIQEYLQAKGFKVSHVVVESLIESLGYSKQLNQKMIQIGKPPPVTGTLSFASSTKNPKNKSTSKSDKKSKMPYFQKY